jgi:polyhydroxyalkanoate synthesis regulator phasin
MSQKVTHNELRLLALIAYRDGEITEERCKELTGWKRDDIRKEMERRTGRFSPYTEACNEIDELKRRIAMLENKL